MARIFLLMTALLMGALAYTGPAVAVISTFDTGLEGWTGLGCAVAWEELQGNPEGSLSSDDNTVAYAQIIAPAKFHGAWPASGYVSADIKFIGSGTISVDILFAITDGNTSYQYNFGPPTTSWVTYKADLNSSSWTKVTSSGFWYDWNPPIGSESLAEVLTNVTGFHIRTDYVDGYGDKSLVDNIQVVPLPPAAVLLGSGLAGLTFWRGRKK